MAYNCVCYNGIANTLTHRQLTSTTLKTSWATLISTLFMRLFSNMLPILFDVMVKRIYQLIVLSFDKFFF